ncbi:MAG: hypothetical protein ACXITV_00850 [Luteibaculaceae bacterium]
MYRLIIIVTLVVTTFNITALSAQKDVTTFGFMFKPMLPIDFFTGGTNETFVEAFTTETRLTGGYVGGMLIRRGFTNTLSLETGIHFNRRTFSLDFQDNINPDISGEAGFRMIGYEIPINLLVNIRLGSQLWMITSAGLGLDFFPTDIETGIINRFNHFTQRRHWAQLALNVNYGFELRTEKDGYFYIGAGFHQTTSDFTITDYRYTAPNNQTYFSRTQLAGNYFTLDFRYYFNEPPKKESRKSENDGL